MTSSPLFSSRESGTSVKRFLFVLAPVALVLSACGAEAASSTASIPPSTDRVLQSTTNSPVSPPVEPTKVEPNVSTGDQVDIVMQAVAADEGIHMPDGMATEYADIICEGLDDGLSPQMLVRIAVNGIPTWDADQHAFLIGVSIGAKCPEYAHVVGGVA